MPTISCRCHQLPALISQYLSLSPPLNPIPFSLTLTFKLWDLVAMLTTFEAGPMSEPYLCTSVTSCCTKVQIHLGYPTLLKVYGTKSSQVSSLCTDGYPRFAIKPSAHTHIMSASARLQSKPLRFRQNFCSACLL